MLGSLIVACRERQETKPFSNRPKEPATAFAKEIPAALALAAAVDQANTTEFEHWPTPVVR